MGSLFAVLIALFVAFWMVTAVGGMAREFTKASQFKWLVVVCALFILVGAGGFFAQALSAVGVFKLSNSREWPAGYVTGMVVAADGGYIVPLVPAGRVQLYDSHWRFLRGWNVDAGGGQFKVQDSPGGAIEVFTARGNHHFTFAGDGRLIASTQTTPDAFSAIPESKPVVVPTSPLLWVFSNPFLSWALGLLGALGIVIVRKIDHKTDIRK